MKDMTMVSKFFSKSGAVPQAQKGRHDALSTRDTQEALSTEADLPPVVARMVVEIRSDGTRTIARGALEDLQSGERISLEANATTPLALARELTKTLLKTPALASNMAKQAAWEALPIALKNRLKKKLEGK
jgi:hypothetical protein